MRHMLVCRKQGFESNEDNVWTSSRCPPRRSIPPASASENAARQLTRRPSSNAAISAPTDIPLGPDLFPAVVRSFVDSARPAADLAAARLSFKALRACADEQLPSLYHSVVTDGEQGPALSLRRFLCANSLAIGISAEHAKPYCDLPAMMYRKPKSLDDAAADGVNQVPQMERLHAFAQEKVRLEAQAAHDPALLLAPLQEQEQADLDRIESLTLSGNIRCFPTLCKLLVDVRSGSGEGGNSTGPSTGSGSGSGEQGPGPSTGSSSRACWKQLRRLDLGSIRTRREGADRINGLGFLSALPHLEEIIVGYDLLQGVQEIKGLRRIHIYSGSNAGPDRIRDPFRVLPLLEHVSLLDNWDFHQHPQFMPQMTDVLSALPATVNSVSTTLGHPVHLKLGKGADGQQETRELRFLSTPCSDEDAETVLRLYNGWPRAFPKKAAITLLELPRLKISGPWDDHDAMPHLRKLLRRAERVVCCDLEVAWEPAELLRKVLRYLRATPRRVTINAASYFHKDVQLELPVVSGGGGLGLEGAAGTQVDIETALAEEAAELMVSNVMDTPRPIGCILQHLRSQSIPTSTARPPPSTADSDSSGSANSEPASTSASDSPSASSGPDEYLPARTMLLLSGRGVMALAAHSTDVGDEALKAALEGLSCEHPPARPGYGREYRVLPESAGVLLAWGQGAEEVAAAAVDAVRGAAARLGKPVADVRATVVPYGRLYTASVEFDEYLWMAFDRTPVSGADLLGALGRLRTAWMHLRGQWDSKRCTRRELCTSRPGKRRSPSQAADGGSSRVTRARLAAAAAAATTSDAAGTAPEP